SPDRSHALIALVALDSVAPAPPGRLRLRGLDPQRHYRIRPVTAGRPPARRWMPSWWDTDVVLSGAALAYTGLAFPYLRPDQAVLCRIEATEGARAQP
ncbi:GH36 C-terminal domain-containing protein, partial [Actinoplanes sp. NPDC051633]|uniref:GH36 C-terminal domain-containing protein n=1 Tax=Actinoplanes sp. NPDC051633 TaxID=3155670 RepID=UPI00341A6872